MEHGLSHFLDLETRVWQALVDGDAGADAALLSDDFLGVYGTGFADKAGHVGQLAHGPTVVRFQIAQARLVTLAPRLALLAYRADYLRVGSDTPEAMYVSSIWQNQPDGWRNIFSQDSAESDIAPV